MELPFKISWGKKFNKFVISNGKLIDSRRRFIFPTFQIFSSPSIRISEVKRRPFNVIDRAVQTARQQIMSQEDDAIFKSLDDALNSGNKNI